MRKYLISAVLAGVSLFAFGCSEHHYQPYGYYGGGPYYSGPYMYRYPGTYRVYRGPVYRDRNSDRYRREQRERYEHRHHD